MEQTRHAPVALVRHVAAAAVGCVVTAGLFWIMQSLISMGQEARLDRSGGGRLVDFVRLKREALAPVEEETLPERQPLQQEPPPQLDLPTGQTGSGGVAPIRVAAPAVKAPEAEVKLVGGPMLGAAPADTTAIPLVRVQPIYPPDAAEQRLEGWVEVVFTISTKGSVKAARATRSSSAIFERAALRAIRRWKYKPKVVDGQRVETRGVSVRLTFKLES